MYLRHPTTPWGRQQQHRAPAVFSLLSSSAASSAAALCTSSARPQLPSQLYDLGMYRCRPWSRTGRGAPHRLPLSLCLPRAADARASRQQTTQPSRSPLIVTHIVGGAGCQRANGSHGAPRCPRRIRATHCFFGEGPSPPPSGAHLSSPRWTGCLRPPLCQSTAPARPCAPQPQGTRRSRCLPVRLRTVSRPSVALPRGRRRECPKVRHGLLPRPEREAVPPALPGDVAKTRGVQQRHRPGGARRRGARLDFLPPSLPRMHRRPHSQPSGRHGGVSKIASKPANCSARS